LPTPAIIYGLSRLTRKILSDFPQVWVLFATLVAQSTPQLIAKTLSLIMKKILRSLILIFSLICSHYNFSQNNVEIKILETLDGKTIKLLPNNRVLFETLEKVDYSYEANPLSVTFIKTEERKPMCGGIRISHYIYQSYGFYKFEGQNLILTFTDENPIEKVDIESFKTYQNEENTMIKIIKDYSVYDLIVFQNEKKICQIISFGGNCEFAIEDRESPLILKYNNRIKTIELSSEKNSEITVFINDLKGDSYLKNDTLVYNINELIEK
jgi:hypothetical protein